MNQKSSLREVPQFVSWVLTGNSVRHRIKLADIAIKEVERKAEPLFLEYKRS
jgi:hypothetical protein